MSRNQIAAGQEICAPKAKRMSADGLSPPLRRTLLLSSALVSALILSAPAHAQVSVNGTAGSSASGGKSGGGGGGGGAGFNATSTRSATSDITGGDGGDGGTQGASGLVGSGGSGMTPSGGGAATGAGTAGGVGTGTNLSTGSQTSGGRGGSGGGGGSSSTSASTPSGTPSASNTGSAGSGGSGGTGLVLNAANVVYTIGAFAVQGGDGGDGGDTFGGALGSATVGGGFGGYGGSGAYLALGTNQLLILAGGSVTGGNGGDGGNPASAATSSNAITVGAAGGGGVGVVFAAGGGTLTNSGTISGGNGGHVTTEFGGTLTASGASYYAGGTGISGAGGIITIVNNGTISGGDGGYNTFTGASPGQGASGIQIVNVTRASITNNSTGIITGGNTVGTGATNAGGSGVYLYSNPLGAVTLTNYGTIKGGHNPDSTIGNPGIYVVGAGQIILGGGNVSSGTGIATDNAIEFSSPSSASILELRDGWSITGRVRGGDSGANAARLDLGGSVDSTFDVSLLSTPFASVLGKFIGFNNNQKTGTSTWTLIGQSDNPASFNITTGTIILDAASRTGGFMFQSTSGGRLIIGAGATVTGCICVNAGGAVEIASRAGGTSLTTGSFFFSAGSTVSVTLGAPSTTALITAGSLYVYGGTVNVASDGSFGAGDYTLVSYTGAFGTTTPLTLGSLPTGYTGTISVNTTSKLLILSVEAPPPEQYWNGASVAGGGPFGGSGDWTASGTNWTNSAGTTTETWDDGFANFTAGSGGSPLNEVVIKGGAAVNVAGLRFLTAGYVISGDTAADTLTLAAASGKTKIEVGTGVNATIAAVIGGTTGLEKTGTGTLVLTGTNTYTGNTTITAGTLQIGDGGANGSILGTVANAGTLAFNRDDSAVLAFGGLISGAGAVTKAGSGEVQLTAANSYTGGTTITAGVLRVGDGTSGSIVGNVTVTGPGVLVFQQASGSVFAGNITGTGTGAVKVQGAGVNTTLTFSGTNTYSGGTSISGITLIVGSAASGSITGSVVTDDGASTPTAGRLAFNRSGAVTFDGLVSGAGSLRQMGAGALTLTGDNTYAGGTVIDAGRTLYVGAGGATGAIGNGDVTNGTTGSGGTLVFDRTGTLSYSGVVTNGKLRMQGGGTLVLTGTNALADAAEAVTIASGSTVQLGDGTGVTGSFGGAGVGIANSGTLTFNIGGDASTGYNFSSNVTGSGKLVKENTGRYVAILGDLSLAGGVEVNAGMLLIGFGTTGSLTGDVVINAGDFAFNRTNAYTYSGNVTKGITGGRFGVGGASIGSSITTILGNIDPGISTYISNATLQLGDGTSAAGTITGPIATSYNAGAGLVAGRLAINHDADEVFANDITGIGQFRQMGGDVGAEVTVTLTGANSWSGGTLIDPYSILQIGNGLVNGVVDGVNALGNVLNDGSLIFNQPDAFTLVGAVSGNGSLTKLGAGTLTLTGAGTYTGGTTITAGTLQIGDGASTVAGITGDVVDNSALVFNLVGSSTLAGDISGTGTLTKLGGGHADRGWRHRQRRHQERPGRHASGGRRDDRREGLGHGQHCCDDRGVPGLQPTRHQLCLC